MRNHAAVFLLLLGAAFTAARSASFTYDSGGELSASLDANNDGLQDWILVDKTTGVRQFGLQQSDGSFVWAEPDSVGMDQITALTVGRFDLNSGFDGYAVAAPTWNAVSLFENATGAPLTIPSVGIGPNMVVAFDFSGDATDDLAVATEWDNPPNPANISGVQVQGATLGQVYGPAAETGPLTQGNRARFRPDAPWMMGALRTGSNGVDFVSRPLLNFPGGQNGPDLTGFATNVVWTWGEFSTNVTATFLFYAPGASALMAAWVDEPAAFQFVWTEGTNFDLGQPIASVVVATGGPQAELVVLFGDGSSAGIYDFDGFDTPILRQVLTAAAGMKFSMGTPLGGGDFGLLQGPSGPLGNSTGWTHWKSDGHQYNRIASGAVPAFSLAQSRANVLIYSADPELSADAPLLQSLRVGEWSDSAALSGGTLTVTHESTVSHTLGLGNPTTSSVLGILGLFAAVNQRSAPESSVVLAPPGIQPPTPISFSPPPGAYPLASNTSLAIRMTTTTADPILYRTTPSLPWIAYDPGNPPALTASSSVYAFVNGSVPSPIYTAAYIVAPAPPLAPPIPGDPWSAWAQAFGLTDPNADPDGDGFTNLQECQAGTDPLDPKSTPPATDPGTVTLIIRSPGSSAPADTLVELAWPAQTVGLSLEAAPNLTDTSAWSIVAGPIVKVGAELVYYLPSSAAVNDSYFRLHR